MSWLGESAAVAVLSFDVDAESPILAQGRRYADHAMVMTHQAYGPQVGVPRLLELLDDFGLKATFFVPGLTADRYPQTVERIAAAGHEVGHHSYDDVLGWEPAQTEAGDYVTLRAEMDCFVVVSACPQDIVAINNQRPSPVAIELLDG